MKLPSIKEQLDKKAKRYLNIGIVNSTSEFLEVPNKSDFETEETPMIKNRSQTIKVDDVTTNRGSSQQSTISHKLYRPKKDDHID